VLRGSIYGEFRPSSRVTLALGMRAQHSSSPLLSFEEFSAGNYTIGRGYDPGVILGDRGVGVQAELRVGSVVPPAANAVSAEPYIFLDQVWIRNLDQLDGAPRDQNVTSFGGGVRATLGDQFRLDLALAVPIDRVGPLLERPDPRFLLSLTTRLWPWSLK
jgi:hemolysin activation/secretion protein